MMSQTDPEDFSRAFSSIKPKALPPRHKSSFFYWPINVLNSPPYSLNWLFITQNLAGAIQYPHNKDSVKLWGAAWMLLSKIYALNTFVWTSRSLCEIFQLWFGPCCSLGEWAMGGRKGNCDKKCSGGLQPRNTTRLGDDGQDTWWGPGIPGRPRPRILIILTQPAGRIFGITRKILTRNE